MHTYRVSDGAPSPNLMKFAYASLAVSVTGFLLKLFAALLTGSVGLLSDALETTVNIVATTVAIIALRAAMRPADERHHFGHGKAEYLSALFEGASIFVAAALILYTAIDRLINPQPLEELGIGVALTLLATVMNVIMAFFLIRAGRQHRSILLEADGRHLLTDVWTSVGVIIGVILVGITRWEPLDPLIAIAVAINILFAGWGIIKESMQGLLDAELPDGDNRLIRGVLERHAGDGVSFHGIQTRASGRQRFLAMHVLVPGAWSVQRGHDYVSDLEGELQQALDDLHVSTHIEPREDPRSWDDVPAGGWAEAIGAKEPPPAPPDA